MPTASPRSPSAPRTVRTCSGVFEPDTSRVGARFSRALLVLVFVSGAVGLVYQSLWVRELSLILGSTTYAIGTVLAAFMAGLGVGAWVLGRRADRAPSPLRLYATLELAVGLAGLASPFVLAQGNGIYAACYARFHAAPTLLGLARFLIGFGFVAAPALLMGGTVPVAARYLVRRRNAIGRGVGLLYAINTFGAAVGALVVPFTLLPLLGIRASLLASGATNLMIAGVAWAAATDARAAPASDVRQAQLATAASPKGVRGLRARSSSRASSASRSRCCGTVSSRCMSEARSTATR